MFVRNWMSMPAVATTPDAAGLDAARIRQVRQVRRLPVVLEGKLFGIVTESNIFRALCIVMGFHHRAAGVTLSTPAEGDLLEGLQKAVGRHRILGSVSYDSNDRSWQTVVRMKGPKAVAPEAGG